MSFPGVPVFGGVNRVTAKRGLRRTRRFSWMVSGWFECTDLISDHGGTTCMTLGCPDDFIAIRLGFPNVSQQPWRITRAIARPSNGFNDYVTPTGEAAWTVFTTANAGADSAEIVAHDDAPTEIEVSGLGASRSAQAAQVQWTWTDWAPLRSLPPDPATGMRVLMLRALVPSSQTITFANGQLRSFTGNKTLNHGHDVLIGGLKFNIDVVSNPDRDQAVPTHTWIDNQLAGGSMFPMVQFMTHRPGVSGIVTGDSHAQGTSTTEQFSGFMYGATALLGQAYSNTIPFSMANCAVGGLGSEEFFARFEDLIQAVQPSYAVLPGWTFNDKTNETKADQAAINIFLARLLNAADLCEREGILPILLTPFPRNAAAMMAEQMVPWHWLRDTLLQLRNAGAVVIDATSILGRQANGIFDGTYDPSLSSDQMHPNDAGHMAVARALADTIRLHL